MTTQQTVKPDHHRGHNEGSISRSARNGKFRAQTPLINGHRISRSFRNKKDAHAWLYEMQREADKGYLGTSTKVTLQSYLEDWLTRHAKLKEKTKQDYRKHLVQYINPKLGQIKIGMLKRLTVENFYLSLLEITTPSMVAHIHRTLHSALEDAVEQGMLMFNPAHHADHVIPEGGLDSSGNYSQGEMRYFNDLEARTFLVAARSSPYEALYHLAIKTGARQGELLGLKWSDIDWQMERITIQRQYQSIPSSTGTGMFTTPKSNAGRRTIHLGKEVMRLLKNHQANQELAKVMAGEHWHDNNLIFPSSIGTPKNASNLYKDFTDVLARAGVKRIRFHDLRHTAATLMLNHGIPAIVVSGILGHSNSNVTLTIYGHLLSDQQLPAAQLMDTLVTPIEFDPDIIHTNRENSTSFCTVLHHKMENSPDFTK